MKVKNLNVPVSPDSVLSPNIWYCEELTTIEFITSKDTFARVTFDNLDSLKVSRGEYLPYQNDWNSDQPYSWVKVIENSTWLKERFDYELKHYGSQYEFTGNVKEMLVDFKHYVFVFHDEFIEVIARGVWFEERIERFVGGELILDHPFQPLPLTNVKVIEASGLRCQVRMNPKSNDELMRNSKFCQQKMMEFALELEPIGVDVTLYLINRYDAYVSCLKGGLNQCLAEFEKVADFDDVRPYIESYMKEIAERRKQMGLF